METFILSEMQKVEFSKLIAGDVETKKKRSFIACAIKENGKTDEGIAAIMTAYCDHAKKLASDANVTWKGSSFKDTFYNLNKALSRLISSEDNQRSFSVGTGKISEKKISAPKTTKTTKTTNTGEPKTFEQILGMKILSKVWCENLIGDMIEKHGLTVVPKDGWNKMTKQLAQTQAAQAAQLVQEKRAKASARAAQAKRAKEAKEAKAIVSRPS